MGINHTAVPDLTRGDVGLALVGEWNTSGPEHQERAADATLAAWQSIGWPAGLLSHSCLFGEDGHSMLQYSQWTDESAAREFACTDKPRWAQTIDSAAPGIEHCKATPYRLYRNTTPATDPPAPGCLVAVTIDFDSPDVQRQRDWVDHVFAAAGTTHASPERGMLAAHFHLSVDGTRVLNLAEWTTAQAHHDAASSTAANAEHFRTAVQEFPGVVNHAVQRYTPCRYVTPGATSS